MIFNLYSIKNEIHDDERQKRTTANRVALPISKSLAGERLSNHFTYGSGIQRYIKMRSNFLVIVMYRLVPSTEKLKGDH